MSNREIAEAITTGYRMKPPQRCPDEIAELMAQCWLENPELRPPFSAICDHLNKLVS